MSRPTCWTRRLWHAALAQCAPTHVFITTWMRQDTEAENIRVNAALVRNLLDALSPKKSVRHVALVTGLKHYLGPFEAYAKLGHAARHAAARKPAAPAAGQFLLRAGRRGLCRRRARPLHLERAPSAYDHRPGRRQCHELGTTLAVYATICKETGRPFQFPGSEAQWKGLSDVTDARMLAKQLVWAADTDAAKNEAFNIVNGDVFRWSWLWPKLAGWFGVEAAGYSGQIQPLEAAMAQDAPLWREIATRHGLAEPDLDRLASAWHTDLDLGRPLEVMTDMANSRRLGFAAYQATDASFFDLFERLRAERLIP
jgi:hypothetical protein